MTEQIEQKQAHTLQALAELTPAGQELFKIIYQAHKPITRAQIKKRKNVKQLNPHSKNLLDEMCNAGILQKKKKTVPRGIQYAWVYRVPPKLRADINNLNS